MFFARNWQHAIFFISTFIIFVKILSTKNVHNFMKSYLRSNLWKSLVVMNFLKTHPWSINILAFHLNFPWGINTKLNTILSSWVQRRENPFDLFPIQMYWNKEWEVSFRRSQSIPTVRLHGSFQKENNAMNHSIDLSIAVRYVHFLIEFLVRNDLDW